MIDHTVIAIAARRDRRTARHISYGLLWLLDHWALVFLVFFGVFLLLPFIAPVFMHAGWNGPAQLIYAIYSTQCHQMAQRSFFLFGPQPMYNIAQLPIPITGAGASDMLALRAFIGNANLGWKVAWSDRMVYMYGGVWLAAVIFAFQRHRRAIHEQSLELRERTFHCQICGLIIGRDHNAAINIKRAGASARYQRDLKTRVRLPSRVDGRSPRLMQFKQIMR